MFFIMSNRMIMNPTNNNETSACACAEKGLRDLNLIVTRDAHEQENLFRTNPEQMLTCSNGEEPKRT